LGTTKYSKRTKGSRKAKSRNHESHESNESEDEKAESQAGEILDIGEVCEAGDLTTKTAGRRHHIAANSFLISCFDLLFGFVLFVRFVVYLFIFLS